MNRLFFCCSLLLLMSLTAGCVKFQGMIGIDSNLLKTMHQATRELLQQPLVPLSKDQPILVASLVNIDNLDKSSTFGRTLSEYSASYLVQQDYKAIEMKLRDAVFFKQKGGTFFLSRNVHDLSDQYQAQAVILGTYSLGSNVCYLSLRLVRATDSVMLGAVDYKIPLGSETRRLLGYRKVSKY